MKILVMILSLLALPTMAEKNEIDAYVDGLSLPPVDNSERNPRTVKTEGEVLGPLRNYVKNVVNNSSVEVFGRAIGGIRRASTGSQKHEHFYRGQLDVDISLQLLEGIYAVVGARIQPILREEGEESVDILGEEFEESLPTAKLVITRDVYKGSNVLNAVYDWSGVNGVSFGKFQTGYGNLESANTFADQEFNPYFNEVLRTHRVMGVNVMMDLPFFKQLARHLFGNLSPEEINNPSNKSLLQFFREYAEQAQVNLSFYDSESPEADFRLEELNGITVALTTYVNEKWLGGKGPLEFKYSFEREDGPSLSAPFDKHGLSLLFHRANSGKDGRLAYVADKISDWNFRGFSPFGWIAKDLVAQGSKTWFQVNLLRNPTGRYVVEGSDKNLVTAEFGGATRLKSQELQLDVGVAARVQHVENNQTSVLARVDSPLNKVLTIWDAPSNMLVFAEGGYEDNESSTGFKDGASFYTGLEFMANTNKDIRVNRNSTNQKGRAL